MMYFRRSTTIRGVKIAVGVILLYAVVYFYANWTYYLTYYYDSRVKVDLSRYFGGAENTYAGVKFHAVGAGYKVPNIMHYTWYDSRPERLKFRFHHMISMLSAFKYNKPEAMYVWYEILPQGPIWLETLKRIPVVKPVFRRAPTTIFGNRLEKPEHQSDLVRLEAVMRYGGIYTDLDVVVLKSMEPLRKYETTLGDEEEGKLCNGVIIGARQAKFLNLWHQHYASFDGSFWGHHSIELPGQLARSHPDMIHIEKGTIHRPNWRPENRKYMYELRNYYNYSDNYAVHLYYRWYNREHNPEDIKGLDSTLGQIFRQIYYGSPALLAEPSNATEAQLYAILAPG